MKNYQGTLSYALALVILTFQGCRKKEETIGQLLFRESRNRVYKEVSQEALAPVLKEVLADGAGKRCYSGLLAAFYQQNHYEPVLIRTHLPGNGFEPLLKRSREAGAHGLDPILFRPDSLEALIGLVKDKKAIAGAEEACRKIAELEVQAASSLAAYAYALQYGATDPEKLYERYGIETSRPDSLSTANLFGSPDLAAYLDSIQPEGKQYKVLQEALKQEATNKEPSREEVSRLLQVNLERLRWKNKPSGDRYVLVNIADFSLRVVAGGQPVLEMKVCVGEGSNADSSLKLADVDPRRPVPNRPGRWETPQLNSLIYSVQVNPVWNIPESIASGEIVRHAAADPYYLDNSNIDVYKDGKRVEDTRRIDWTALSGEDLPYTFKQRPGSGNALGKIKFLFKNNSSIYLHDTPAKAAFGQTMRAVSHGCIRVEKPLELAHALFGDSEEFRRIQKELEKEEPEARNIALPEKVPVYITYVTCWQDRTGKLQFRPDVYGLDAVLFSHLRQPCGRPVSR